MSSTRSLTSDDGGPPPRKSTLFCPACDHQSGVDGDWRVSRTDGEAHYACPDCGATVTRRPAGPDPDEGVPALARIPGASLIDAGVAGWHRVTTAWIDALTSRAH